MNAVSHRVLEKRHYSVDLRSHHAQCELNFHRFLRLLPGCRDGQLLWVFSVGPKRQHRVLIKLVESAPYTSTLDITQEHLGGPFLGSATWRIRLYHDVEMAEVVAWNRHQHWKGRYDYPNEHMYHPDEKLALNCFVGEWLEHCRKQGIWPENLVIKFSNS
jgi:uncharacterized protein